MVNSTLKKYDLVKLLNDESELLLAANSVGTIIFEHRANLFEVEFISKCGRTRKVATLEASQITLLNKEHIYKKTIYYGY